MELRLLRRGHHDHVLGLDLLGDGLRDLLDPTLRGEGTGAPED